MYTNKYLSGVDIYFTNETGSFKTTVAKCSWDGHYTR